MDIEIAELARGKIAPKCDIPYMWMSLYLLFLPYFRRDH